MRRFGLAILVVFAFGCAATQPQPEIVGREYATRISGDGVVEADDSVARFDDSPGYGTAADARAASDEIHDMLGSPTFVEEPALRVLEVSSVGGADGARIVVQLSRTPDHWKSSELSNPPRCMVDVNAPTAKNFGPKTVDTGDPLAPRVRVGHYPEKLRLVVDQSIAMAGTCDVTVDESAVIVSLGRDVGRASAVDHWQSNDVPPGAHAHAAAALARASGVTPTSLGASATDPTFAKAPPPPLPADMGEPYATAAEASPFPDRGPAGPPGDRAATTIPPPPMNPYSTAPRAGSALVEDDGAAPRRKVYSGRRISLEFKDADILNVLRIIADVAHRNIVATDDVTGRVTIVLYDVPWDQALEILLKSTGLEMVEYDDVITISTAKRLEEERKARLAAQQAGRQLEPLQTAYLKVNYVKARDLMDLLRGRPTTSGAGAMTASAIAGDDSAGQRRGLLSGRGSVMVNDATNTLIVRDISDGVANARELVRRLDVQTPQVAIQGLIFEADTDIGRDLGVRWGASYVASPETGNPTGKNFPGRVAVGGAGPRNTVDGADAAAAPILVDFPAAGVAAGAGSTLGLVLGSLDGSSQIDAEVTAIEQAGKGKVISRPKVITLNNAEAQIQSLEILRVRLPSTGTVINTGAGGVAGATTQATQAIDTGIILRVTPQVSNDGYILLQMFVKSSVPSSAKTDEIPNEISRQATSQVLVRDGETVVIGGVYRQQATQAESGVPWLKDVPILGWLFKNRSNLDRRQELLVFITPRVVWRTVSPGALPSAATLWNERDKSAYQIMGGGQEPNPISAIPG